MDFEVAPERFSRENDSMFDGSVYTFWEYSLKYLPDPPGAVLMLGGEDLSIHEKELVKRGHRVTRCDYSGEKAFEDFSTGLYDVVLLKDPLKKGLLLNQLIRLIRNFLKPGGVAVLGAVPQESFNGKSDVNNTKDLIATLYENGFSIQAKNGFLVAARKTSLYLRSYRQGDEKDILKMFKEVFGTPRTMAHWYWKFRDNPFGAYKIVQAVSQDGILAGHYSGYPVPFYASADGGKSFRSLQIGDIMTRPGFRNLGLGKTAVLGRITDYFHHKFCLEQVPFMYGYVAGNHRKFGEKFLRYRYLSSIPYHVLDITPARKKKRGRLKQMFSGVRIEEMHRTDVSFDRFFLEVAGDYRLLVKRDSIYLNWRYLDCPDGGYRLFSVKRFGKLAGWSVFKESGETISWGDALFRKETANLARILIEEVIHEQFPSARRIDGWFSKEPRWWTEILHGMGFEILSEPNGLAGGATVFNDRISLDVLNDSLYYTKGDSDLF